MCILFMKLFCKNFYTRSENTRAYARWTVRFVREKLEKPQTRTQTDCCWNWKQKGHLSICLFIRVQLFLHCDVLIRSSIIRKFYRLADFLSFPLHSLESIENTNLILFCEWYMSRTRRLCFSHRRRENRIIKITSSLLFFLYFQTGSRLFPFLFHTEDEV